MLRIVVGLLHRSFHSLCCSILLCICLSGVGWLCCLMGRNNSMNGLDCYTAITIVSIINVFWVPLVGATEKSEEKLYFLLPFFFFGLAVGV